MVNKPAGSKKGTLFIISAPSGAGKTSLVRALIDSCQNLEVSISFTTRPVRPGERDGVDYHFVNRESFQKLIQAGDFLEYAQVFDHYYGTSRSQVLAQLERGLDIILEIDWQGAQQVRRSMANTVSIFILPPSRKALEERLTSRKQDSAAVIKRRLQDAMTEISHYDEFDYVVVNDDFDSTLREMEEIIKSPLQGKKGISDNVINTLKALQVP